MAIKKQIILDNGIAIDYHRIVTITTEINQRVTILVKSYLSDSGRQIEKDFEAGSYKDVKFGEMKWPYVHNEYFNPEYDENMTISKAYEWLKSQPEYEGAEDV